MPAIYQMNFLLVLALVLAIILHQCCVCSSSSAKSSIPVSTNKQSSRQKEKMKPQLVKHPDDIYLLEFISDHNDHCEQMEPVKHYNQFITFNPAILHYDRTQVVQRLEADLKTKVRRINIFRRKEFMSLLESIGFDEGGQLPFYYNRRTGQAVCGATTYMNLKRWGTGDLNHMFQDPPQTLQQQV